MNIRQYHWLHLWASNRVKIRTTRLIRHHITFYRSFSSKHYRMTRFLIYFQTNVIYFTLLPRQSIIYEATALSCDNVALNVLLGQINTRTYDSLTFIVAESRKHDVVKRTCRRKDAVEKGHEANLVFR
jgi:hypothetical protein